MDLYVAAGLHGPLDLPCVMGRESIARLADGSRVYVDDPPAPFGSMAQHAPVELRRAFHVPDGLDASVAVSLGIAGLAAWLPLTERAQLRKGETVLVPRRAAASSPDRGTGGGCSAPVASPSRATGRRSPTLVKLLAARTRSSCWRAISRRP